MIIWDENTNKSLTDITMLLSKSEAIQLISYLDELLKSTNLNTHYHLNNDNYSKEITLALYDKNECLSGFEEKYKRLILSDER